MTSYLVKTFCLDQMTFINRLIFNSQYADAAEKIAAGTVSITGEIDTSRWISIQTVRYERTHDFMLPERLCGSTFLTPIKFAIRCAGS